MSTATTTTTVTHTAKGRPLSGYQGVATTTNGPDSLQNPLTTNNSNNANNNNISSFSSFSSPPTGYNSPPDSPTSPQTLGGGGANTNQINLVDSMATAAAVVGGGGPRVDVANYVKRHKIHLLLDQLVKDILLEKPTDSNQWMLRWFLERHRLSCEERHIRNSPQQAAFKQRQQQEQRERESAEDVEQISGGDRERGEGGTAHTTTVGGSQSAANRPMPKSPMCLLRSPEDDGRGAVPIAIDTDGAVSPPLHRPTTMAGLPIGLVVVPDRHSTNHNKTATEDERRARRGSGGERGDGPVASTDPQHQQGLKSNTPTNASSEGLRCCDGLDDGSAEGSSRRAKPPATTSTTPTTRTQSSSVVASTSTPVRSGHTNNGNENFFSANNNNAINGAHAPPPELSAEATEADQQLLNQVLRIKEARLHQSAFSTPQEELRHRERLQCKLRGTTTNPSSTTTSPQKNSNDATDSINNLNSNNPNENFADVNKGGNAGHNTTMMEGPSRTTETEGMSMTTAKEGREGSAEHDVHNAVCDPTTASNSSPVAPNMRASSSGLHNNNNNNTNNTTINNGHSADTPQQANNKTAETSRRRDSAASTAGRVARKISMASVDEDGDDLTHKNTSR